MAVRLQVRGPLLTFLIFVLLPLRLGSDPSTDLRGTGMLGLVQMVHVLQDTDTAPLARDLYKLSLHPTQVHTHSDRYTRTHTGTHAPPTGTHAPHTAPLAWDLYQLSLHPKQGRKHPHAGTHAPTHAGTHAPQAGTHTPHASTQAPPIHTQVHTHLTPPRSHATCTSCPCTTRKGTHAPPFRYTCTLHRTPHR